MIFLPYFPEGDTQQEAKSKELMDNPDNIHTQLITIVDCY